MLLTQLRRGAVLCLICLVLFGLAYPLLGVGLSQLFFKGQADGSITATGSIRIGQDWSQTKCPGYLPGSCVFQGRPDNLGPYADKGKVPSPVGHGGDNPLDANGVPGGPANVAGGSGATNLGPRSAELESFTKELIRYWHARDVNPTSDLVTTSGSGLDPDITPADAVAEIPMVSNATGLSRATLTHLIDQQTQGRQLGFLGSPYVVVLELNEALAQLEEMSIVAISALVPRRRSTTTGQIVSVTQRVKPWVRTDVELTDGTGSVTLRFTGRSQIPGFTIGRGLIVEGTPADVHGDLVILNPVYSFSARLEH